MSVAELQSGFMGLVKELYSADETAARRRNFKRRYRSQRRRTRQPELATAA
jgi:hypothetical protein